MKVNLDVSEAMRDAAPDMYKTLRRISERIAACPHIVTTDPDFYEWQDALGFIKIWADNATSAARGEK